MLPRPAPPPFAGGRWVVPFLGVNTFLTAIGNTGLISVMPVIGRLMAIPDYLVASIFSLSALTWAVSSPRWVGPVRAHGPYRYIRAGLVGFILSMGGCALAVTLGTNGTISAWQAFAVFFVLRSVFGLFGSASATATQALVAGATEGGERTRTITMLAGALSLGTIVGPALAPFLLAPPLGVTGPMLGFALLGLLAYAGAWTCLPRGRFVHVEASIAARASSGPSVWQVWRQPRLFRPLTFGAVVASAQAINLYTIGFILIDRVHEDGLHAQKLIGLTMTCAAVAALIAQWGLARLLSLSPERMMLAGAICAIGGNTLAALVPDAWAGMAGFVLASLGYGLLRPGFSAAASLAGTGEEQVAIASAVSLIAGASITLPPMLGAALYRLWTPGPFVLSGAAIALALVPFLLSHRIVHHGR